MQHDARASSCSRWASGREVPAARFGLPHAAQCSSSGGSGSSSMGHLRCKRLVTRAASVTSFPVPGQKEGVLEELNQRIREGHSERQLVQRQASKKDSEQPSIASVLPRYDAAAGVADVCVVGCGPAGLALAAELAGQQLQVALVGVDAPFVNNYGVWYDEFRDLGLEGALDATWPDAICYFGAGGQPRRVGRGYGRVCRRRLRAHLLERCAAAGVRFLAGEVQQVDAESQAAQVQVKLADGKRLRARLVTLAAGGAAGKFLQYEQGAPTMAAQTAYGIEAEVEGFEDHFDQDAMVFMDFRRHHTGLWDSSVAALAEREYPAGGGGLWGSMAEVPSFLYAMPLAPGRVFLEETCLVAKPAMPFALLERRLRRRLAALGIKVTRVIEEEHSYIPVGGPLPLERQSITAFGAAANLVHPATGYSIARSLREAPGLAKEIAQVLRKEQPVADTAHAVWQVLWPQEKRRQAAFHVFGMELLATLNLAHTNDFFRTFFRLPDFYWRGFLSSQLSSAQLIAFALLTFGLAPVSIKALLMRHLATSPAGSYLLRAYAGLNTDKGDSNA